MHDNQKPRRATWEEKAEIEKFEARSHAAADFQFLRELERPPGEALLLEAERREIEEEDQQRTRDELETASERAESERILRAEAEIAADGPIRRQRELRRTFSSTHFHQAAAASSWV